MLTISSRPNPRRHYFALVLLFSVILLSPVSSWAHGGHEPLRERWWSAWNWDWLILSNLAIAGGIYSTGLKRLWTKLGVGHGVRRRHAVAFAFGYTAAFLALVSPIDAISDELQWMHMIQHMVLMNVAAPLMVFGSPSLVALWALPLEWRQRISKLKRTAEPWSPRGYILWQPLLLWSVYAFTMWIWHLPRFYEAALHHQRLHDFQHLSFFLVSCLFWRLLLDPIRRLRLSKGVGVFYLFTTSLHATILGVLMALAPSLWYPFYSDKTAVWNVSPLEDQQIAGLIMWMPACMIYAVVAAILFGLWLAESEHRKLENA